MATHLLQLDESALRERLLVRLEANELVVRATGLASQAHRDAVRDEGTPYICHVLRVALILVEELGITDPELVCAAALHDVLEDGQEITFQQLRATFGERVARIVHCLTDEFKHSGLPRAERKELYLERFAQADEDCLLLKLCDRLDNLRSLPYSPNREKREYMKRETETYLRPLLAGKSGVFSTLEELLAEALKELDMFDSTNLDSYCTALRRCRDVRPDYELLATYLQEVLLAMAQDLGIYPIVMGRAKSLESFAEKIQRPGKIYASDPVAEMTDLCGVRVITHTLDEVDVLIGAVRRRFNVDLRKSEDKREKLAYKEFGLWVAKTSWPCGISNLRSEAVDLPSRR